MSFFDFNNNDNNTFQSTINQNDFNFVLPTVMDEYQKNAQKTQIAQKTHKSHKKWGSRASLSMRWHKFKQYFTRSG